MNIEKLTRLTEVSVQSITATELQELFNVLTDGESHLLAKVIRNDSKLDTQSYYEIIGKTIEMVVYRLVQEKLVKEVFSND